MTCNYWRITIGVYAVGVWVDEINGDPEVWFSQELVLVLLLERSGFILNKPATTEKETSRCVHVHQCALCGGRSRVFTCAGRMDM